MLGCTHATHVQTDNIKFTSENINKFSTERIWENLFGNSSCRACASSSTQFGAWGTRYQLQGWGSSAWTMALKRLEQKWMQSVPFWETMKPMGKKKKKKGKKKQLLWKLHFATSLKKKKTHTWHPLAIVLCRTLPFTSLLACISWPKPEAKVVC